jgi:glycosyltransferase involved in cell wall biosynthesis
VEATEVTRGGLPGQRHTIDPALGRTAVDRVDELLEALLGSLGMYLDGAIIGIAHPADYAYALGVRPGEVAKADALHEAADDQMDGFVVVTWCRAVGHLKWLAGLFHRPILPPSQGLASDAPSGYLCQRAVAGYNGRVINARYPLVLFNGHLLSGDASYRNAGISVYIASLLEQFGADDYGIRVQVHLGRGVSLDTASVPSVRAKMSTRRPGGRILWEQVVLPVLATRSRADVVHAPAFVAPFFAPCPQVVTVHDLSFLRYPAMLRAGNRLYLRTFTGPSCRRAAAVIAVSNFTAQEVTRLLGVPAERVTVIHHGVAPRFRPLPADAVADFRKRQGLPDHFVLFLGTLEPRKNLVRLIRAFALMRDPDLHLVLAGAQGWFYQDILQEVERSDVSDRVHFPGFVPATDQALWYNAADVFAYVSVYEGFGMPVLESLACGTPAVASSTTSLPEAGGEGAVLVSPDDEQEIAGALEVVLANTYLRSQLRLRGIEHAASFSWSKAASQTAQLYRQVAQRTYAA